MRTLALHIAEPIWLHALWAVPISAFVILYGVVKARTSLRSFAGLEVSRSGVVFAALRGGLILLALALIVLALARPQQNPRTVDVTLRGRDIVILIDCSKSMLATDVAPSRLDRAKIWINDLVNSVQGDRVALVAFAGVAVVKCPLTLDYAFFRMTLDELSPSSVPRGGTLIGDAIRKTLAEVFDSSSRHRDIVLITDGEDHESFPAEAAAQAANDNVRIIAIGIGSETEGALLPEGDSGGGGTMKHDGHQVRSKMDASTLARVAGASKGGVFLNVGTGTVDLEKVYEDLIAGEEKSEFASKAIVRYEERFQWLLGAALVLLVLESVVSIRRV